MTPTTPTPRADLIALAGRLTKAQREWLLNTKPTLDPVSHTPCAEWWDNPERLYVEVDDETHWLASRYMRSPENMSAFTEGEERLTPLGLELRTLLTSEAAHDHA